MKTFYLIKSLSPFLFFLTAPRMVEIELDHQSILNQSLAASLTVLIQIAFAVIIFLWVTRVINRKTNAVASSGFLKMSCVSKKVFHSGRWIPVEQYLADHHNISVSHGMTPEECEDWMRQAREDLAIRELSSSNDSRAEMFVTH